MAEPILKWAGGKRQIITEVIDRLPFDVAKRQFHEPMFGAGAVTFALEPRSGSINDINPRLMRFYKVVRDSPRELIKFNEKHKYTKNYYYKARERFNSGLVDPLDPIEEASLLLCLNRSCFNGLYRENSKGEFNVPFGMYRKVDFVQEKRILEGSKVLRNLNIFNEDFSYVLREARKGDVVYFDPPYQPLSHTSSFNSYSQGGFDFSKQIELSEAFRHLDEMGVFVVVSNSSAKEILDLYKKLDRFELKSDVMAKRAINSKAGDRGKIRELILWNTPKELRPSKKTRPKLLTEFH